MPHITFQEAADLLDYEPTTGVFTWRRGVANVAAGTRAGSVKNGHRYIRIGERDFLARRLAWLFVHGEWPGHTVKVANGDKDDCRAANLVAPKAAIFAPALTATRLREIVNYDRDTGIFTWKEAAQGRRVGDEAGSIEPNGYRILTLDGERYLASRCAWLHVNGVWPHRQLRFADRNKANCAIGNLSMPRFVHGDLAERREYERLHRATNPDYYRDFDLRRTFGISLEDYQRKLAAQNGVCAICGCGETEMRGGKVKELAVDHDHDSGALRDLLCAGCNKGLGAFIDSPARLRAAAEYIERHAARIAAEKAETAASNVIPLRSA